ncbi:hypothetical protein MRB53_029680 [Persea americana]|uniref:Uncharacterized protein n=1 Tax=Persea americana TaxID=3435 RepID=A0ACC2KJ78_PERAE|nr:hypothetical protein MRB53_029680 [Persea americana]
MNQRGCRLAASHNSWQLVNQPAAAPSPSGHKLPLPAARCFSPSNGQGSSPLPFSLFVCFSSQSTCTLGPAAKKLAYFQWPLLPPPDFSGQHFLPPVPAVITPSTCYATFPPVPPWINGTGPHPSVAGLQRAAVQRPAAVHMQLPAVLPVDCIATIRLNAVHVGVFHVDKMEK